jgi:hypothetical protein
MLEDEMDAYVESWKETLERFEEERAVILVTYFLGARPLLVLNLPRDYSK